MTPATAARQRDTDRQLSGLLLQAARSLDALVGRYGDTGDGDAFGDALFALLEPLHAEAVYLGRYRGGDLAPREADDRRFAEEILRNEDRFLAAFQEDLARGRYTMTTGEPALAAIRHRAGLYLGRVRGTANEVWALTTGGSVVWEYDDEAENCPDCLDLAARSPYLWDALPTYPRAGQTRCLTQCRCLLRAADGSTSF